MHTRNEEKKCRSYSDAYKKKEKKHRNYSDMYKKQGKETGKLY